VPKLIETKNNYLFASNIKYRDNLYDVTYDARTYRFMYPWSTEAQCIGDGIYPTTTVCVSDMITDVYDASTNIYTTFTQDQIGSININSTNDCINKYNDLNVNCTSFYYYRFANDHTKTKYAYYLSPFTYTTEGPAH